MVRNKTRIYSLILLLILLITGCSESGHQGPKMTDIPVYPDAKSGQSMQQQIPGGFMGGSLKQFTTRDSFDEVVAFYVGALEKYETEVMSHSSDLGQQTAISIRKKNGMMTVAIQEFVEEDVVNITLMEVGQ